MEERELLLKLRRRYKDKEIIGLLNKQLSKLEIEVGKQKSYIQELEYHKKRDKFKIRNLEQGVLSMRKEINNINMSEPRIDLKAHEQLIQEALRDLRESSKPKNEINVVN